MDKIFDRLEGKKPKKRYEAHVLPTQAPRRSLSIKTKPRTGKKKHTC
jgi:hypothetical protein